MPDGNSLHIIHDQPDSGIRQMEIDEFLFRNQIQKKDSNPILRFYHFNEDTFTVGYGVWVKVKNQLSQDIPTVRRITGGGIVWHKPSDLTYALIVSLETQKHLKPVRDSYKFIHEALRDAFRYFGLKAELKNRCCDENEPKTNSNFCFEAPVLYDVMLDEKKIAGAGQKRTLGYLLHQGSIAWKLVEQMMPGLTEAQFTHQFAQALSKQFQIPTEETTLVSH